VRRYRRQEPPFNVTIELSKGCNLACAMCAMPAIQEKPGRGYSFMKPETLERVMSQVAELGWNCRVGFAMRGEPTMHPDYVGMVAIVKRYLPRAHVTMLTNAGGLLRSPGPVANVTALFDAGLSVLGLDDYEHVSLVPKTIEALEKHGRMRSGSRHPLGFTFYRYPQDRRGNPHVRRPRGSRTLVRIRDIMAQDKVNKTGTHSKVFNYAGLAFPPDQSMAGKRCHHPFRQLVIHWDGNVPLCCNDWASVYNCGDVHEQTIEEIWQSDAMGAAREKLIRGERDFGACDGCNHRSYRVGLLPDLMGRGRLHLPDAKTRGDIAETLLKGSRDKVVRVPWRDGR
jgi:radical SAM protein with 4Fe4S-binding SPASM domain